MFRAGWLRRPLRRWSVSHRWFRCDFAFAKLDWNLLLSGLQPCSFSLLREPKQRFFKLAERAHLPAAHNANEREQSRAFVRIRPIKHGEPLVRRKARLPEGGNQRGQLRRCKHWLGGYGQRSQVEKGTVNSAFAAGL